VTVVVYDPGVDASTVDFVAGRVPFAQFVPVADLSAYDGDVTLALAAGPDVFLLDALEAGVPVVVPTSEETRRYVRDGGGVLTGADAESVAAGVMRVVTMAPAARRVMGRIGRNYLLNLVG
jgi:glycosyltransferase involved in cell wall biosynthesis